MGLITTAVFFSILQKCWMISNREELILQDPSMWPGHLESFGSQQPTDKIDERDAWPDPTTFFRQYVDKNKPILLKGLAKQSPGYTKFTDDYFKDKQGSNEAMIYVEPELKENRTKVGVEISMKEFIGRYHNETIYMVSPLPPIYRADVLMPAPLRCDSTKTLLSKQLTWFSTGGTKSVLHSDSFDNINCLFRGSKDLWFIEPVRNRKYVPIDRPNGYSSLDVDKVNYTRYPELRNVDMYYKTKMEQGDCLFIPSNWFHQVNSVADENKMNLAVNIWFEHKVGHIPEGCSIPESEATVDKYEFTDPPEQEEEENDENPIEHISNMIPPKKYVTSKIFPKLLLKSPMVNPQNFQLESLSEDYVNTAERLYQLLEYSQNGKLSLRDFNMINNLEEKVLMKYLDNVENIIEELITMVHQMAQEAVVTLPSTDSTLDEDTKESPTITDDKLEDSIRTKKNEL